MTGTALVWRALAAAFILLPTLVGAQTAIASRITAVTLYPGGATVERTARVAAGTRSLRLACLPASFDVESLRLEADAGIALGEVTTRSQPRKSAAGCERSPIDKRIADLEDQLAAIDADADSNALALDYLKGVAHGTGAAPGGGGAAPKPPGAAPPVGDVVQALRGAGQAALLQQHQSVRRKEALHAQLDPLIAERDRLQKPDAAVRDVTINLNATAGGDVRLRYQVAGPGWAPAYRATLDATTGRIRLERLAQVAQASGEDWTGIKLRLSTGRPRSAAEPLPQPWQVSIATPPLTSTATYAVAAAPAPPMAAPAAARSREDAPPSFDVSVFQGTYATEFEVPSPVDLTSGDQRLTLSLGSQAIDGTLRVRTTPLAEAGAFLIVETDRPPGVWPVGDLQLYRDGAFVGTMPRWSLGDAARVTLGFGRDDLVQVQSEPQRTLNSTPSFIGGKVERHIARAYTVRNLHKQPIRLEVLEATPISADEAVTITQRLNPPPTATDWQHQPGVVQWESTLEAGATARYTADYTATAAKDANLRGWR
ncbi:MAG: DUF4139 domain-containing protein [Proteobacteria bacterium]|nr:DUF4139 domain-containing protein [Pseudomonadota bacterium]